MNDINKAFNLPLSSDGKKLIEATGNICAVFNLPNEAATIANFVNSRDELIEQQQARIAELRNQLKDMSYGAIEAGKMVVAYSKERDELSETVEERQEDKSLRGCYRILQG